MKRVIIVVFLLGLILNSFSQSSVGRYDIVIANDELIVEGLDFKDWLADSSGSATFTASNGLTLTITDFELGGTLERLTEILGAGNTLRLGTSISNLNDFQVFSSGAIELTAGSEMKLIVNGGEYAITNATITNNTTGKVVAYTDDVEALIEASEAVIPMNFNYTYSTDITDSRPGQGFFRLNNATYSNVTQVYIDYFDLDNVTKDDYLALADTGYLFIVTDNYNYVNYKVDGFIDAGNYYKFNVSLENSKGLLSGDQTLAFDISNGSGGGGLIDVPDDGLTYARTFGTWDNNSFTSEGGYTITDEGNSTVDIDGTLGVILLSPDGNTSVDHLKLSLDNNDSIIATLSYDNGAVEDTLISYRAARALMANGGGSPDSVLQNSTNSAVLDIDTFRLEEEHVIAKSMSYTGEDKMIEGTIYSDEVNNDKLIVDTLLNSLSDTALVSEIALAIRKILYPNDYVSYLADGVTYTTPSITLNVPTKVLIPTTVKYSSNWNLFDKGGSDFALRFESADSSRFHITMTTSMRTSSSNVVFEIFMYKNGNLEPGVAVERKIGTGADVGAISVTGVFDAAENDYIEIYVLLDGTSTITFTKTSIVIKEDGLIQ